VLVGVGTGVTTGVDTGVKGVIFCSFCAGFMKNTHAIAPTTSIARMIGMSVLIPPGSALVLKEQ